MLTENISSDFPYQSHYMDVLGSKMHYIDEGTGDPILLLHGMPASSYIWRKIIPHLVSLGRCIAPDLIGMGESAKPSIEYSIFDHIKYMDKFIEELNLKNITVIMHGWGSIIGINYAVHHSENCKGLVFYEAYLRSLKGEYLSLPYEEQLYELQESHYDINQNGIRFVDQVLPQLLFGSLSEEEMNYYRNPFALPNSGKVLNQYVQEILPSGSEKINKLIDENSEKLMKSKLPKLLLYSMPGFITTIPMIMWAKESLPSLEIADIGEALHCAQESNPEVMGETISIWLQAVEQSASGE